MERFVFDPKTPRRIGIVGAALTAAAILFFGVPMIAIALVAIAEVCALHFSRNWYRRHRGHPWP